MANSKHGFSVKHKLVDFWLFFGLCFFAMSVVGRWLSTGEFSLNVSHGVMLFATCGSCVAAAAVTWLEWHKEQEETASFQF